MMEARSCAQQPVVIVGGGTSAGQATVHLSKNAPRVRLPIRHDDPGRDTSHYLVDKPAGAASSRSANVRSGSIKRVASAVDEGSMAARLVHDHLARSGHSGR
jgi:thioredoxin reductase (NADPH)